MREASRLRKSLADETQNDADAQRASLVDAVAVGNLLSRLGDPNNALAVFSENVETARKLASRDGAEPRAADDLAIALMDLGESQSALADNAAALRSFESAAAVLRNAVSAGATDSAVRTRLGATLRRVAELRSGASDDAGAMEALQEARATLEPLVSAAGAATRRNLALVNNAIGAALVRSKDWAGAAQAFTASANIIEDWLKAHRNDVQFLDDLAFTRRALGDALQAKGDNAGAESAFRDSIGAADAELALQPGGLRGERYVVVAGDRLGSLLLKNVDPDGALPFFLRARDAAAAITAQTPSDAGSQASLKLAVDKIGFVANARLVKGDYNGAIAALIQAAPRAPEQNWLDLIRADALMFLDRPDEARPLFLAHRGEISFAGKIWEALVLESFANSRARGWTRPLLLEIENAFSATPSPGQ